MANQQDKISLNMKLIPEAKICNSDCDFKNDDGTLEVLGEISLVYCIGCGRKCHMECHKVPTLLINSVKMVPPKSRNCAYMGDLSYLKIVCDNCANLLMANVPMNTRPCFQVLFEQMANKVLLKKIKELEEELTKKEAAPLPQTSSQVQAGKRKKADNDNDDNATNDDLKSFITDVMKKLNDMEHKASTRSTLIESHLNDIKGNFVKANSGIESSIKNIHNSLGAQLNAVDTMVNNCSMKLDRNLMKIEKNDVDIDNGLQKGFNNLMETAPQWLSPCLTPIRCNENRSSLRKSVLQKSVNIRLGTLNETPKSNRFNAQRGPKLPTEVGSNEDNDIFGPKVRRRVDFNDMKASNDKPKQKMFKHDAAIYLRYVNAQITAEKMLDIVKKNPILKEAIDNDPDSVEINRLVKSSLTEDQIANFKNGISYRIGCVNSLLNDLMNKANWATHWEMRQWDPNFTNPRNQTSNAQPNSQEQLTNDLRSPAIIDLSDESKN